MDARLREHLRAWEAGDVEAERRYLAARLRSGDVSSAALRCAAWVGDPAARALLGADAPAPRARGILGFVAGLPCPDHEVALRAGLVVLDAWSPGGSAWSAVEQQVVDAVRAWAECPCARHLAEVDLAAVPLADADPFGLRGWLSAAVLRGACGQRSHGVACPAFAVPTAGDHPALRERLRGLLVPWVLTRQVAPAWRGCYDE